MDGGGCMRGQILSATRFEKLIYQLKYCFNKQRVGEFLSFLEGL